MNELTLAEMAREIERRRKNTLPKSLYFVCDGSLAVCDEAGRRAAVPDDPAHAILRDAMVMATNATRDSFGWGVMVNENRSWCDAIFADADHGGCPTRSLFAAFLAVFPEPKETT